MNRRASALSVIIVLVAVPTQAEEKWSKPPAPPKQDAVGLLYGGTVTAITKSSITLQWPDEPPKEFALSDDLAAGRIPLKPRVIPTVPRGYRVRAEFMYRLADVKIGDRVLIFHAHLGDLDICDHICIRKRPDGGVPPLPEEAENLLNPAAMIKANLPPGTPLPPSLRDAAYIPYHEWQNAHWNLVDKGIPYPEKFGERRRWPVAPMPREVKPTP